MKQSSLLEFECSDFAVAPDEDKETNPGIYGKSLALWLAEQLRSTGLPVGEVIAEDFGWCVPVKATPQASYIACAATEEKPDQWRVFVFAESGLIARLRGQDRSAEAVAAVFAAVRRCLESAPNVRGLREEPA
jgi:hypothetical protein